ncbi:MAG: hypothetical protein Kow00121_46150 [Elainellaceae cyanobacterium]
MSAQPQETLSSRQNSLPNALGLDELSEPQTRSHTTKPNQEFTKASKPQPTLVMPEKRAVEKRVSIGVKATILATVFGVLPVLTVGVVAYRSADRSITEQIAQEKITEVNQLSDQLSRFLQERLANTKTAASVITAITAGTSLSALDSTEQAATIEAIANELTTLVQDYRTYANIALYDPQGEVLVQSRGSARELNQKQYDYFQRVIQTGQPVISEPVATTTTDGSERLAIYTAAPVLNESGSPIAVVAAKIPVDFVGNAVLRTSVQDGRAYRLIDSSGQIFQNLPITDPNVLGSPAAEVLPLFPEIDAQKQRQAWLDARNQWLNAYAPVRGIENLNWSIVASTQTAVAFVPQQRLLQAIVLGTVITALLAAVVGAILADQLTRPLQRVAKTVEKLGQGELETRVSVQGNDELASLGANVNQMAAQIQTLLATLRQNAEQLSHQNDILATLARNEALIQGDARAAAQAFTEAIAQTLQLERAGIWIWNSDRTGFICLDQYQQSQSQHSDGEVLYIADVPAYFQVLESNPLLVAEDTQAHPIIQALLSARSIPPETTSILSVPIQISGQTVGMIQCDQVNTARNWQVDEQTFVTSVANLMSLALESEFLQEEVSHLLDVVSEVEEGDLTTQARVSDRTTGLIADTFNRLIERLTDVLTQVVEAAQQVSTSANQQKQMADRVATNTEQQAQAVSQVLYLTGQVEQEAEASVQQVQTTTASLQTMQTAIEQGQEAITKLMQGIEVLQAGTDRIVQQMKTLGEFVGLADQFVQDQSQIASLTQTLALNASLVAARASEQRDPRQFSVVAREFDSIANQVSRLAQQTNEGLMTLEQRSAQIHSVVSIIDSNIQNLGGLVRGFTEGVDQSNQVFTNVQVVSEAAVQAGSAVAQANQTIVNAAQSAAEVGREIAELATKTALLSQQTRSQSEEMDTLSNQLLQSIRFFQLPSMIQPLQPAEPRIDLSQVEVTTLTVSSEAASDEQASIPPTQAASDLESDA